MSRLYILPATAPKKNNKVVIFGTSQHNTQANAPNRLPVMVTKRGLVYLMRGPMAKPINMVTYSCRISGKWSQIYQQPQQKLYCWWYLAINDDTVGTNLKLIYINISQHFNSISSHKCLLPFKYLALRRFAYTHNTWHQWPLLLT